MTDSNEKERKRRFEEEIAKTDALTERLTRQKGLIQLRATRIGELEKTIVDPETSGIISEIKNNTVAMARLGNDASWVIALMQLVSPDQILEIWDRKIAIAAKSKDMARDLSDKRNEDKPGQ